MKFLKVVYGFAAAVLLAACATQVAPSGGPEDKLPPRVAAVYPALNTTNHPEELFIKLEFDEWINGSIPRSAVSISPPIEKKMRFEVHGKTLELTSNARLDSGTTYIVTFAGGIKDLRGNALASPFQVVFSTGAVIDSLTLDGRVMVTDSLMRAHSYPSIALFLMGEERNSKRYLEKYKDSVTQTLDSLPLLTKEPPLYVTRADSLGVFHFAGLKAGRYRVLAFVDGNGNQKIEPVSEKVGVWIQDLQLSESSSDTIWVPIADQDTSFLELESVTQPYANILEAAFTRPVYFDSAFADTTNCFLVSPEGDSLYPSFVYQNPSNQRPDFYFATKPKEELLYKFICRNAQDSLFRKLDTLRNEVSWEWQEMASDTLDPSISKTMLISKAKSAFPHDSLIFAYNKPMLDSIKDLFFIASGKDTTPVQVSRLDPIRFLVKNEEPWPTDATIDFLRGYQDTTLAAPDSNGVRDTVIELKYNRQLRFETVAKLKLATLKGMIPGAKNGAVIRLLSLDSKKEYIVKCGAGGSFMFEDLMEGNYFVDYYYPEEGTDYPDAGSLFPFRYGKAWRSPADTLKLKNGDNDLNSILSEKLPALL